MSLSGSLFLSFFPSRREFRCQICRKGGSLRENYFELNSVWGRHLDLGLLSLFCVSTLL